MSVTVLYIPVSTVKPHPQCSHGIFPRASDDNKFQPIVFFYAFERIKSGSNNVLVGLRSLFSFLARPLSRLNIHSLSIQTPAT